MTSCRRSAVAGVGGSLSWPRNVRYAVISVQKSAASEAGKQIMPHFAGCSVFSGRIGGGPPGVHGLSPAPVGTCPAGGAGVLTPFTGRPSAHVCSYFQSGSLGCVRSQRG